MLRLRRGMSQVALAELACVSSFVRIHGRDWSAPADPRRRRRRPGRRARGSPRSTWPTVGFDASAAGASGPPGSCRSRSAVDPITLTFATIELGRQFLRLVRQGMLAPPGTGCAVSPVSPALIRGCCSTSSPPCTRDPGHPGIEPLMSGTLSPVRSGDRWFALVDGAQLRRFAPKERGLSAAELAGKAGIGLSTASRLERQHQVRCRTRTLVRLAALRAWPLSSRSDLVSSGHWVRQQRLVCGDNRWPLTEG